MSLSPAQNFSKPPPVPDAPVVIRTPGFSSLKSSAAASANGKTVEEPSTAIEPESSPPPEDPSAVPEPEVPDSSSSPQAAAPNASVLDSASASTRRFPFIQ